jgi:hypothetical protein
VRVHFGRLNRTFMYKDIFRVSYQKISICLLISFAKSVTLNALNRVFIINI